MVKTTVYLPEELKTRIAEIARRDGMSEAAAIRAALDEYARNHEPPRPRFPLFSGDDLEPITDWDEAMRGFGED
jgi:hypothetical protein